MAAPIELLAKFFVDLPLVIVVFVAAVATVFLLFLAAF